MPSKPPIKTAFATEIAKLYPGFPSRTLARFLLDKHKGVYDGLEDARKFVRYVRGAFGKQWRSSAKVPKPLGTTSDGCYPLPEPLPDTNDGWHKVPVQFCRALIVSDIHIPFHDKGALDTAIAYGRKIVPDTIILNGDIADFYRASSHDQDPLRRFRLADEIEMVKAFLEHLRDKFPHAEIWYKEGNHEERLSRNVWRDCPQLAGVMNPDGTPCVDLPPLLDLAGFGIRHVGMKQPILLGEHLHILHGHEFYGNIDRAASVARGLYNKVKCNALCSHVHATSHHTEPGLDRTVSTWSIGCLCKLNPHYMPINRWNHGFAVVHYNKGDWYVESHKIINNKVV